MCMCSQSPNIAPPVIEKRNKRKGIYHFIYSASSVYSDIGEVDARTSCRTTTKLHLQVLTERGVLKY